MRLGPYRDPVAEPSAAPAPAPAPIVPAAGAEVPRDPNTGRFSKANFDRVAGEVPPEQTATAVVPQGTIATPETPATPAAPAPDPMASVQAYLAANPDAPTAQAPAPTAPVAQPQQQQTPELMQVAQWANNPQQAAEAVNQTRVYAQLNQALNRGDVAGALQVFAPQATEAIKEHLFQTYRDEFAQRIVDEGNGVRKDPAMGTLQQQVAALTQYIQNQHQQNESSTQQQQETRAQNELAGKLNTFMTGLYASAGLTGNPNLPWLDGRLRAEIQANPQAMANIRAGRFGSMGEKFRELYVQFQPLLTAAVVPPPSAAQPGSTQLMAAPAGTSTTSQAPEKLATPDGGMNVRAFGAKLKSMLKAV